MIEKYICYALIFVSRFLFVEVLELGECLEGETWYEWCQKCRCSGQGNHSCERYSSNCSFTAEHLQNVIVFSDDRRCHYSHERKKTICVEMVYQKELNGTQCVEDSYFYDNSTFCECDLTTMKYLCHSTNGFWKTSGGVCNPEEEFMENMCYKCFCTFTRFRFCKPSKQCFDRDGKPGNCPSLPTFYPKPLQDLCTFERYQECYTDHGCIGPQKCCRVSDCFLRCVDPV